ncbi:MAG: GreA/GreB family elongation factor [Proteobacteria bacterium]|nr:GreA/GreB family elongation factor [Pseudomonadota bacterium]
MSRAFVKENDLEHAGIDIPERPISKEPNYVTQNGYDELKKSFEALEKEIKNLKQLEDSPENKQKKMKLERDLRYFLSRIESSILVESTNQARDKVLFGAWVKLTDENNKEYLFQIVGEDEADIKKHKLSYVSPLAKSLLGGMIGDEIVWTKADGSHPVIIEEIKYI